MPRVAQIRYPPMYPRLSYHPRHASRPPRELFPPSARCLPLSSPPVPRSLIAITSSSPAPSAAIIVIRFVPTRTTINILVSSSTIAASVIVRLSATWHPSQLEIVPLFTLEWVNKLIPLRKADDIIGRMKGPLLTAWVRWLGFGTCAGEWPH